MWLILLMVTVILLAIKLFKSLRYWHDQGIDSMGVWGVFKINFASILRLRSFGGDNLILEMYKDFPNSRLFGTLLFDKPLLVIREPELIKQLAVKDFDFFENHSTVVKEEVEPLWGKNLFALQGHKWRDMRATLSPAFTSAKMKSMFVLISECAEQFALHFYNKKEDVITLEMKDTFTRFTNDVIASTAFGIKCDSLDQRENEFYMMGKEVTSFTGIKLLKMMLIMFIPVSQKILGTTMLSKKAASFFRNVVKETMEYREKEGIVRPDMIHLLMEAQKGRLKHEESSGANDGADTGFATVEESKVGRVQDKKKRELTDDDLTAQALLFFFAGFDSVATLMCFLAYELALNPDIHDRLQEEVDATCTECDGTLTYEALSKMKYLDMVVSETLRKWPATPAVDRVCTKPYTLKPKLPHEPIVHVKEGDTIWFPIFGLHRDEKFYPAPEKFDPERFSDEKKHQVQQFSYIPFGAGPRNCIGSRFALLEAKAVIFHLLTKFNIVVVKRTQIPLVLSKKQFVLGAENGIWLGFKKRKTV